MTICGNFLEIELGKEEVEIKSWEKLFEEQLGRKKSVREIIGGFGRGLNYFALLQNNSDDFSRLFAICTGFLTGHPHFGLPMTCCKTTMVFLSPLKRKGGMYGISFANAGANFGNEVKKMGVDDILIFGKANQPVAVLLDGTGKGIEMELREFDPDALVFDTLESIAHEYEYKTACAVGPAAFKGVKFASAHLSTPLPSKKFGLPRAAARGGIGLVLSAKNIKAIGVKGVDEKFPEPALSEVEKRVIKQMNRDLAGAATEKYRCGGTWGGNFDFLLPAKALPAYNHAKLLGEEAEEVYGLWRMKLEEKGVKVENEQCSPCPIKCVKRVKGSDGTIWRLDYEPVALMGCDTGVFDLDVVLKALWLANAYGLDAVSTGSVIAWYFEHNLRRGKSPTFGDKLALSDLIKRIAFREGIGDVLAEGVKGASEKLGDTDIAMQVKGLETAGYPAWSNPGYAFAVRGMCHTSMETYSVAIGRPDKVREIKWWVSTLKKGAIDAMLVQSGGFCHFARKVILPALPTLLEMYTGVKIDKNEIEQSGLQTYLLSRAIDTVAGFDRTDDTLPERAFRFGTTKEWMEHLKDRFYEEMGFDNNGRVTDETLKKYGLSEFAYLLRT
jgi:aldehyde:ferredoxin oxidoreductase